MLGRGRLRRGVSLEVIVEEDDNAEVMLDPTPIMENDDEGHDEDDEDDSENGGSTPGSPSGSGGGCSSSGGAGGRSGGGIGGAGGGGGRSSSGAEERRRKRERRRTIGGLSRVRSVSCEALTLLDTSDMDSCCSEWDDDDDMSTGSSNYVTLNRPISRRRILESTQSQCDSEDSGIEYQSNEDDPALEDQSSIEDRKDVDQSSVDIHEQETATESDDDDDDAASSEPLHDQSRSAADDATATTSSGANAAAEIGSNVDADASRTMDADAETIMDASADADAAGTSVSLVESSGASTHVDADVGLNTIADADTGITTTDADHDAIANTEAKTDIRTDANVHADADVPKQDAQVGAEAAGEDVLLSAKTGKHLFEERSKQGGGQDHTTTTTAKYLQEYTANEVLENDKLVIVETTPPVPTKRPAATQRPVDAAEEELQLKRAAYTIRNKEVQLEELPRPHTVRSVKQLFEDLKTPVRHFHAWRDLGRFRDIKSNPSSKILRFDRSDSIEAAAPGCLGVGSSFTLPHFTRQQQSRASPHASEPSTLPKVSSHKSQHQQEMVTTKGGQSVMLRKPMVRGFNVKKALMEDPRTFHPNTRGNQPAANNTTTTRQQPTSSNKQTSSHHSRKNHVHFAKKSHHSSDATMDRSDTESLASDISEDSGVSNDSNTSMASSGSISTYRAFDAYTSDPSFKWIDPAIMAKIRSVGTTVIFFGPRPRPRHHDGTVHRSVKSTPSGLHVSKGGIPAAGKTSTNTTVRPAQKDVSRSSPVPAPRIVGVVRKRNSNTSGATPLPTDPCSDHSRASTPGRCQ